MLNYFLGRSAPPHPHFLGNRCYVSEKSCLLDINNLHVYDLISVTNIILWNNINIIYVYKVLFSSLFYWFIIQLFLPKDMQHMYTKESHVSLTWAILPTTNYNHLLVIWVFFNLTYFFPERSDVLVSFFLCLFFGFVWFFWFFGFVLFCFPNI